MRLSMKAIADFKSIYRDYFDIELTDDEANIKGLELLALFQHICKKIPTEDMSILRSLNSEYRPS